MSGGIHLVGFLKLAGEYSAGWRHPQSPAAAGVDLRFAQEQTRRLEAVRFDAVFVPDLVGVPDTGPEVLERVATVNDSFEPTTLVAALSTVTDRIGLIATASTSYSRPEEVIGTFASLHRLSGARAGWNVVTSLNDAEARNYGRDAHLDHEVRYRRAEEFVDEVRSAWQEAGIRPVLAQAGSSDAGRGLAARIADIVFARALPLEETAALRRAIREQAASFGRDPESVRLLPELPVVVAATRSEAEDAFARVRDLLHPAVALADVEYWTGTSLSHLPREAPLPPLPPLPASRASRGAQAEIYRQAEREGLTIGDLARIVADGDGAVIGSAGDVADYIEEYASAGAVDGFTVSFPWQPGTLAAFTELVVPELRRRGLFRLDYEGNTLREHLGLSRQRP